MEGMTLIAIISIITAGVTIALGSIGPALGEGRAVSTALSSLAQQPDAASTITRTLFVGLAMDSIIAWPTNKVRVMVLEASGCCASEFKAVETARPSPSAGPILPSAIVIPAVMIEAMAIMVMLSMGVLSSLMVEVHAARVRVAAAM